MVYINEKGSWDKIPTHFGDLAITCVQTCLQGQFSNLFIFSVFNDVIYSFVLIIDFPPCCYYMHTYTYHLRMYRDMCCISVYHEILVYFKHAGKEFLQEMSIFVYILHENPPLNYHRPPLLLRFAWLELQPEKSYITIAGVMHSACAQLRRRVWSAVVSPNMVFRQLVWCSKVILYYTLCYRQTRCNFLCNWLPRCSPFMQVD